MKKSKLPLFPEDVIKLGKDRYITKRQLRDYILKNHKSIADQYCISKKFNSITGEIEKRYAWHSIIDVLNRDGLSDAIIKTKLWTSNEGSQN